MAAFGLLTVVLSIFVVVVGVVTIFMPFFVLRIRSESIMTNEYLGEIEVLLKNILVNMPNFSDVSEIISIPQGMNLKTFGNSGANSIAHLEKGTKIKTIGEANESGWVKVRVMNPPSADIDEGWLLEADIFD